jgi:perosamine synthetase
MMKVSQVQPWLGEAEAGAAAGCFERAWLTEGPQAAYLRDQLGALTGAQHVHLAPNGTLGLFLALLALDLPRGSEVVMPSFTFMATASAAVFAGLKPVCIDVDPHTFSATPEAFERAITPRTSLLMPVHIYGQAAYVEEVAALGERLDIPVLEDAAQACGVRYRGRHAGTFGTLGVLSFFADKTVTMGEGGAVLTQDAALARRIKLLRNQGRESSGTFVHEALGMNFRVTDLQCAVGNVQLSRLEHVRADRQRRYGLYEELLRNIPGLQFMAVDPESEFIPFRFPILSKRMPEVRQALEAAGVQTRSMFYPLHRQPCLQGLINPVQLPVCERLYEEGLCLPIHQDVSDAEVVQIGEVIRGALTTRVSLSLAASR